MLPAAPSQRVPIFLRPFLSSEIMLCIDYTETSRALFTCACGTLRAPGHPALQTGVPCDDSRPKISIGRNADQLVALACHQVHCEDVANSRRVVFVLARIGLQRRGFL